MRAARLHAARDVRLEEVPTPAPGPGEVLVRVRAVGICPSDWRLWDSGDAGGAPLTGPIIQGHEFSGDVAQVGAEVARKRTFAESASLAPGDRVAVEPSWHCGRCDQCLRGRYNICRHVRFPSFPPTDGALAEYVACPAVNVVKLPRGVDYVTGALAEPLGVALHALRLAAPAPQERLLILGAGMIGLCVLQIARLRGLGEVTVIEPVAGRRALARRLGAAEVLAAPPDAGALEADVVLECSGFSGAVEEALELASPGGKVVVVGIPHPETVTFEANRPRRKELTMIFTRRSCDTLQEALALLADGTVNLDATPVRRFSLEQVTEALEATAARPGDMLRAVVSLDL